MIPEAVELYGVDPSAFVAARKELVRELKAAKRTDDAAVVAKLPKPRLGEHTLNRVARESPEVVAEFARAVGAATAAQSAAIGGGDGAALRTTSGELRTATSALLDAATEQLRHDGRDGPAPRDEVLGVIRSLTNEAGVAQLVAGIVGSGSSPPAELFAGAPEPPERPARTKQDKPVKRAKPAKRPTSPAPEAHEDEPPTPPAPAKPTKAELAAERRRQKEIADATQAVARAERDVRAAQRALDAATEQLAAAVTAREEATTALEALREGQAGTAS